MKCPNCGSDKVQYSSTTSGGGYSFLNGCCCASLFGPLGLLAGLCGSGSSTDEFWICQNCGHKFSMHEANKIAEKEEREADDLEKYTQYKNIIQSSGKPYEVIKQEYEEAQIEEKQCAEAFNALTDNLKQSNNTYISKVAKKTTLSNIGCFIEVLCVILGIICLFVENLNELCIVFVILFIVVGIIQMRKTDDAEKKLANISPEYKGVKEKYDIAKSTTASKKDILDKYNYIIEYEKTHTQQ